MLFELEEGESHKFYRIERHGTRVELQWGRIGTDGQTKTLEHATEAEAKRTFDAEVARRKDRGYRKVVDEAAPHDAVEARNRTLAASGAGAKYTRYLFQKRQRRAWVELRGTLLATSGGDREFGSAAAAKAAHDETLARYIGDGWTLEEFGKVEKTAAATRAPRLPALKEHGELEAQLVANPHDDGLWLVFEDWLLETRDPRAAIVEVERTKDAVAIARVRAELAPALYGKRAAKYLIGGVSRAGMLLDCVFEPPKRSAERVCAELAASVGARMLVRIVACIDSEAALRALAPLAALEVLEVPRLALADAASIAPFPRLKRLYASVTPAFRDDPRVAGLAIAQR